jgi:hypothetical protein
MEHSIPGSGDLRSHLVAENGGFPEPPPGEPVRVVRAAHQACGTGTEIRLPAALTAEVVRRVHCSGCGQEYSSLFVEDVAAALAVAPQVAAPAEPQRRRPSWILAGASAVFAAAAVIATLALIQELDEDPAGGTQQAAETAPAADAGGRPDAEAPPEPGGGAQSSNGSGSDGEGGATSESAELVQESNFALAIPPGWQRSDPPRGATFSAKINGADATLWIERDQSLSVRKFERQSLKRLKQVAGNARVESRTPSPTDAGAVIRLLGDARSGQGGRVAYEVTVRSATPFHYYLVTSQQPGANALARRGVRLVHGSFIPSPTVANKEAE